MGATASINHNLNPNHDSTSHQTPSQPMALHLALLLLCLFACLLIITYHYRTILIHIMMGETYIVPPSPSSDSTSSTPSTPSQPHPLDLNTINHVPSITSAPTQTHISHITPTPYITEHDFSPQPLFQHIDRRLSPTSQSSSPSPSTRFPSISRSPSIHNHKTHPFPSILRSPSPHDDESLSISDRSDVDEMSQQQQQQPTKHRKKRLNIEDDELH